MYNTDVVNQVEQLTLVLVLVRAVQAFQERLSRLLDAPWVLSTGEDERYVREVA